MCCPRFTDLVRVALVSTFVACIAATASHAAVAIEWNFNDGDLQLDVNPVGTSKLVNVRPGTPTPGVDGITVNPGGGSELVGHIASVRHGSASVPGGASKGMHTADDSGIPGEDSTWRTYLKPIGSYSGLYGPATFMTVFKPNFSGTSTSTNLLMSISTFNGSNGMSLGKNNGSQLFLHTGGSGATGNSATAATGTITNWDNSAWYMLAGSAEQGKNATVYLRKMTGVGAGTTLFAISPELVNDRQIGPTNGPFSGPGSDGIPDRGGPSSQPFYLGGTFAFASPDAQFGADGTFAFARVYDEYVGTQAGFDAIYLTLVPEPTSLALLLPAAALIIRRRR